MAPHPKPAADEVSADDEEINDADLAALEEEEEEDENEAGGAAGDAEGDNVDDAAGATTVADAVVAMEEEDGGAGVGGKRGKAAKSAKPTKVQPAPTSEAKSTAPRRKPLADAAKETAAAKPEEKVRKHMPAKKSLIRAAQLAERHRQWVSGGKASGENDEGGGDDDDGGEGSAPKADKEEEEKVVKRPKMAKGERAPVSAPVRSSKGMKNTGKGLSKRHKNLNIKTVDEGITKASVKRLVRRGGVKRMAGPTTNETRAVTREFITKIVRLAIIFATHSGRKTVMARDIVRALDREGKKLYGFDDE